LLRRSIKGIAAPQRKLVARGMPVISWYLVAVLGALTAIGPISTDIYLPSFPTLAAEFAASPAAVQRTLAASFIGMALGQAVYGPVSDRFGRRLPMLVGMAIFTLASVGCALAPGILSLSGLRLVQAIGGCAGVVVTRAMVRDLAQGADMVRLMARLMLVFALAPILGPSIGGWLLSAMGWRAVFWLLAAYGVAMVVAVWLLPESLPMDQRQRGGTASVLRTYGRLLRDRRFMAYALGGTLAMAGMFAYIAGSPFVFMQLHGVSPQGYGLYFGLNALGIMAVAQVVGQLAARVPPMRILAWAQGASVAAALALVLVAATGWGGFPALVVTLWCYIASLGGIMPVSTAMAMGAQGKVAGSASAVIGVMQFGIGAGAGLLVSLLGDGSALPMALAMAACGVGGLGLRLLLAR
jgi:DHA1 family bicyclomycin/chloramphenicol resistance-like MFS transporter